MLFCLGTNKTLNIKNKFTNAKMKEHVLASIQLCCYNYPCLCLYITIILALCYTSRKWAVWNIPCLCLLQKWALCSQLSGDNKNPDATLLTISSTIQGNELRSMINLVPYLTQGLLGSLFEPEREIFPYMTLTLFLVPNLTLPLVLASNTVNSQQKLPFCPWCGCAALWDFTGAD